MLGFAFTLAVAGTLLLLDFVGLRIYTIRGRLRNLPSIQSWIDDGLYELQRRAFELYGNVSWDRTRKEVPVTAKGRIMVSLSNCAAAASQIDIKLSPSHNTSRPDSVKPFVQASVRVERTECAL